MIAARCGPSLTNLDATLNARGQSPARLAARSMCRLRKAHRHPELAEQTMWEVFEAERPKRFPYAGRFDEFHAVPASRSFSRKRESSS